MFSIFKHTLKRASGAMIGWGLTLFLIGMLMVSFYDSIAENAEQFQQLLDVYPKEMMAFFSEGGNFTTPEGFLAIEFFSFMPLILGVYAILAGSGLILADEESGVLDLLAAQPVSRSALFLGRALSFFISLIVILAFGWVGIMLATQWSLMDLNGAELLVPFGSLYALLSFLFGLSLLLSMLLPARRTASMAAGIILVAGFFIHGLARLNDSLAGAASFSPLSYYQSEGWAEGLNTQWFLGLLVVAGVFTFLAWWLFLRRDIRVAGESGWKLPKLSGVWTRQAKEKT